MLKAICIRCGKEFEHNDSRRAAKYCSRACYHDKQDFMRQCMTCGKMFHPREETNKFCSRECRDNSIEWRNSVSSGVEKWAAARKEAGLHIGKIATKQVTINCIWCGEEFTSKESAHRLFCSCECNREFVKEMELISGDKNPMYREETHTVRVCPTCNKEFEVDWKNRKNKFCSIECLTSNPEIIEKQNAARALKYETDPEYREHCKRSEECRKLIGDGNRGERSGNWQGGISDYPYTPEFNRMLKDKIRERDNQTCQLCGKEWKPGTRAFHIHHIDYNKKNCSSENLTTLCLSCHPKTNYDRDIWPGVFEAQSTLNQNRWSLEVIPAQPVGV